MSNFRDLSVEIHSRDIVLTLTEQKKSKNVEQCQFLLRKPSMTFRKMTQVISCLTLTPILSASSYTASTDTGVFHGKRLQCSKRTNRGGECRTELLGSKYLLKQTKDTNTQSNQLLIAPDMSLKGWGAYCQRRKADGLWTSIVEKEHINVLELTAAKYAI